MDNNNMNINNQVGAPDEFFYVEETVYDPVYDAAADPSNKNIKEAVGEAISEVPGVLALKGGLTDIFKKDEDLTRGISVRKDGEGRVSVSAKVIAESGYDSAGLIQQLTESITDELSEELDLMTDRVDIEIAETMTEAEFYDKYDADRALH